MMKTAVIEKPSVRIDNSASAKELPGSATDSVRYQERKDSFDLGNEVVFHLLHPSPQSKVLRPRTDGTNWNSGVYDPWMALTNLKE